MADLLYSGLGPRAAVLTTDILAFLPLGGPPAEQGDVTALFSDASSVLAIDRDNRLLIDSSNDSSIDWNARQLLDSVTSPTVDWGLSQLLFSGGTSVRVDWDAGETYDSAGGVSVDWSSRLLVKADGSTAVDWENGTGILDPAIIDQPNRTLFDSGTNQAMTWETRQLFASDGSTAVLDYSTQQPSSGPQTAGAVYTATEQVMIQEMYDALRTYGLLS